MKGTITMEFDGPKTKIAVGVEGVGMTDKCTAVDNLLSALEAEGVERLVILMAVAERTIKEDK